MKDYINKSVKGRQDQKIRSIEIPKMVREIDSNIILKETMTQSQVTTDYTVDVGKRRNKDKMGGLS